MRDVCSGSSDDGGGRNDDDERFCVCCCTCARHDARECGICDVCNETDGDAICGNDGNDAKNDEQHDGNDGSCRIWPDDVSDDGSDERGEEQQCVQQWLWQVQQVPEWQVQGQEEQEEQRAYSFFFYGTYV